MTWTWRTLGYSQCSEHCRHWRVQMENQWPTKQYTRWTLQTLPLNTTDSEPHWQLNPTDSWMPDWTLPTLNNSKQTINAVDCNPANTEHHWLCMLQLYSIDWTLKKLNWCYRLWTLLALSTIELSRRCRLTLNAVYTESYRHITVLNWHYTEHYIIQKEQTAVNATHNRIHTTKHLKSHHDIPHYTTISCHHFTPYALLHHTILHHFTLCSPSRPQTCHIIQTHHSTSHLITNIYLP